MNGLPNLGGYTPADLQYMGMAHLLYPNPLALTAQTADRITDSPSASGTQEDSNPEPTTENVAPVSLNTEPGTANPEPFSPLTLTPDPIANRKSRTPRSKVSRLSPDIQLSLNTMIANGCPYRDIILSLNAQGYTGFNKVNLHNWKRTGYETWLRSKTPEATT